ncbi:MAG: toprim domain-containing protein, partial [Vicinamibacteria bacterium]
FRDRAVFPITHQGQILGFVGRRHPDRTNDAHSGPKYFNTPTTVLFHKGEVLYGADPSLLEAGAAPVLVEGPIDALAVTLAGNGRYVGVAPLGTALTDDQARQIAVMNTRPVVATDADLAGRLAAERAYWLLTQHGADPIAAALPDGTDPAELLHTHGPAALEEALKSALPLAEALIDLRLTNLPTAHAIRAATAVAAARPPEAWAGHTTHIAECVGVAFDDVAAHLVTAVTAWNRDPAHSAAQHVADVASVRHRPDTTHDDPSRRWDGLADQLDPRLTAQSDWPALAAMLQAAHDHGFDVEAITGQLVAESPLTRMPAQDLRYRLASTLPASDAEPVHEQPSSAGNRLRTDVHVARRQDRSPAR